MKLQQLNATSCIKQSHSLFSTRKVMTSKSLNRSLLCLPLKKHLLNSLSLMLQDTSCSLISCLQLYSRSHFCHREERNWPQQKRSPKGRCSTPQALLEHRTPAHCAPHSWGGTACFGLISPTKNTPLSTDSKHGLPRISIQIIQEVWCLWLFAQAVG